MIIFGSRGLTSKKNRCIALVLMIAISNIALVTHTTTHTNTNVVQCALCVCQGEQNHGLIPAIPQIHAISGNQQSGIMQPVILWLHDQQRVYFQRAPPNIA